jgi:hypothetical protein
LDGLQRISTLLKFFANERPPGGDSGISQEDLDTDVANNDISKPTVLLKGRILHSLEGGTALNLPETLVRAIKYARIPIILIEKGSQRRARYEVFRRLNRAGSVLSEQEIRNCTARLLGTAFPDALKNLAKTNLIRSVLALSEDARRKMGVEEAILRLLAFNFSKEPLRHEIREYLDEFMEYAAEGNFEITPEVTERITKTFELIHVALPDGSAFRLKNQGFSSNMFDIVASGVFCNWKKLKPQNIAELHPALQNDPDFKNLIGAGSNTRAKLQGRLELGKRWFCVA